MLTGQDSELMEKVFGAMEEVLTPYYRDGALLLRGAIWFVTADAA